MKFPGRLQSIFSSEGFPALAGARAVQSETFCLMTRRRSSTYHRSYAISLVDQMANEVASYLPTVAKYSATAPR